LAHGSGMFCEVETEALERIGVVSSSGVSVGVVCVGRVGRARLIVGGSVSSVERRATRDLP
jgi:hypothetical protein